MFEALFWIYLVNAVLLINHEIDSAYWKEWELFRLPGGISFFLILHLPMVFLVLYGLVLVHERTATGLIFSSVLSAAGLFAFVIHTWFIRRGHPQFNTAVSRVILVMTLMTSLIQGAVTIYVAMT